MLGFGSDTPGFMVSPSNFSQFDLENFEWIVNNSIALVKIFGETGSNILRDKINEFYLGSTQPINNQNYSYYLTQYNKVSKNIMFIEDSQIY